MTTPAAWARRARSSQASTQEAVRPEHATDPAIELPQHYIEVGGSACLGMKLRYKDNSVTFRDPVIPLFLDHVIFNESRLGSSMIDVKLQRHGDDVAVNLLCPQGDSKVMLVK